MSERVDEAAFVFTALADLMRWRILDVLVARGQATATTIAGELPVSRQAVAKHLAILGRAGLVEGHRRGRDVRYAVCPARLEATARRMARLAAEWDARLAAIKRIAESGTAPLAQDAESEPEQATDSARLTTTGGEP